ncbi:hypothetical protein R50073_27780 [Maricurvus nonylphenolicus]|uniref:DUF4124 domain-containing protein n=1 Tax=Maricurvus nonylphenolicus TaxID=1008307 RepID=UPI0036F41F66
MGIQQLSRVISTTLAISASISVLSETPAIYKWQDDQGRTYYSDTPPLNHDLAPLALPELNLQPTQTKTTSVSPNKEGQEPQSVIKRTNRKGVIGSLESGEEEATVSERKANDQETYYYPPYYYPPYYPSRPSHRQGKFQDKHRYTKPCYDGRGCRNSEKPFKKRHNNYSADNNQHLYKDQNKQGQHKKRYYPEQGYRQRATARYPEFKRPNLYWDPYPYNRQNYNRKH